METIYINLHNINTFKFPKLTATIGQFDGLHLGHMALIDKCFEDTNYQKALITFNPRVDVVLKKDHLNNYLLSDELLKEKVAALGFAYLLIIDFNEEVMNLTHEEFISSLLLPLNIQHLIVGFDFTYGKKALGNIHTLVNDFKNDIKITVIDELKINNIKIGSIQIKHLLKEGNIQEANNFLGYPFYVKAELIENQLVSTNLNLLKDQYYEVLMDNKKYNLQKKDNYLIINDLDLLKKASYLITFIA